MKLYRVTTVKYSENYSGQGASFLDGARWNDRGLPVIYFALSPSIAMLEMANYIPTPRLLPKGSVLGVYDLPDDVAIEKVSISGLASDWADFPYPASTQKLGSDFLRSRRALGLEVPSSAVTGGLENIVVVNPLHPDIDKIQLIETHSQIYNVRAFAGL